MTDQTPPLKLLLVGNPNVGKSTVFNSLCHLNQKTGNYSGVTVESLRGEYTYLCKKVEVVDLPGAYSVYPHSEDELVLAKVLFNQLECFDCIVFVADALNLKRSLLLFQQIQDLGFPVLMLINQIDVAQKRGYTLDVSALEKQIQTKVIVSNAKKGLGIEELKQAIHQLKFRSSTQQSFKIPYEHLALVQKISQTKTNITNYITWVKLATLDPQNYLFLNEVNQWKEIASWAPKRLQVQETYRRYADINKIISKVRHKKISFTEILNDKIDRVLVNPFWGYVFFIFILLGIFQAVYFLAEYPMMAIEAAFGFLADKTQLLLPQGPLNSLITNGIIPGLGGIVVFAPQIGILLYLLYLLEDSGYMARVVFLMDRLFQPFGLNGKSVIPLVSATACAIPAIMAARNIENTREKLITILVTPFMTCSARLPIYSIIIALVIPKTYYLGINLQAIVLMAMYLIGFLMAMLSAFVLKKMIKNTMKSFLVLDLPTYKVPLFKYNFFLAGKKVLEFITGAGKIIFAISILIWLLSYFGPKKDHYFTAESNTKLEHSYLASMGKSIEPLIEPLGYDWKMGVGILTSFVAREVFVGTMSTLYSLDDESQETTIIEKMRNDTNPFGEPVFSLATGMSILIYYAFAMQCISTIAVVYKETKSLKLTSLQVIAMTGLAYVSAFLVYQFFK